MKVIGVNNDEEAVKVAQTHSGMAKQEERAERREPAPKFYNQYKSQSGKMGKAKRILSK
jgi:hypothetical protein